MQLSPTHTLEIHPAELAHDVLRRALGSATLLLEPRRHGVDFVLRQGGPVFAIDVAFLAVKVRRLLDLVILHFFFGGEGLVAVGVGACPPFQWVEGDGHLGG